MQTVYFIFYRINPCLPRYADQVVGPRSMAGQKWNANGQAVSGQDINQFAECPR